MGGPQGAGDAEGAGPNLRPAAWTLVSALSEVRRCLPKRTPGAAAWRKVDRDPGRKQRWRERPAQTRQVHVVRPPHAGRGGARKPGLPPAQAEPGLCGAASGTCPQRLDTGLGMDPGASPAQGVLQVPRGRAFAAARPTELTPEADQLDDYKRCSVLQKQPGTEEGDRRLS